jgi:endoglucanase
MILVSHTRRIWTDRSWLAFKPLFFSFASAGGRATTSGMKTLRLLFVGFLLGWCGVAALGQVQPGEVVFRTDFEGPGVLRAWNAAQRASVQVAPGFESAQALCIEARTGVSSNETVSLALPFEKLAGARVECEARVKAEGVTAPPQPWNGIKFMLHFHGPEGQQWPQWNGPAGSFDWKRATFRTTAPANLTSATLVLGMERVNGRVWFDDVKITVIRAARTLPATPAPGPVYKGHDLPRLRGAMISTFASTNDLLTFGKDWGANHVRWQLTWNGFPNSPADNGDLAAYDRWLENALQHLDKMLPVCQKAGLTVLIDLHTSPGGRTKAGECRIFHERRFQESFLDWWEKIARRYKGSRVVWGYDLVNEPLEGPVGEGLMDWQQLATAAARRVRSVDPAHAIIVEPEPWGGPGSIRNLSPLPVSNVVYSVHMYEPHHFTHQGVYNNPTGLSYPGVIDGRRWDKDQLRRVFAPVFEFQKACGVQIYVGEFSAIRWAPDDSAHRYLKDVIEICEENGWDWAYHAFREWNGWSVEHSADAKDNRVSSTPTSRAQLLRSWYGKNEHPK